MDKNIRSLLIKITKYVVLPITAVVVLAVASVGAYLWKLNSELPSVDEIQNFKYKQPTIIYDSDLNVLAELGEERRYPVSFENVPKALIDGIVATEDSRFYDHTGIDMLGIIRAMVVNVRAGRIVEGASTITQQVARNIYLSPEKRYKRKIKEMLLAYKIDKALTKEEVLELYMNLVNFGRGAYGVKAAAFNYFGKDLSELTIPECALIAGMPKAPSSIAPHINPGAALNRRNAVLFRMMEVNYITTNQYHELKNETIAIIDKIVPKSLHADYFRDYVINYIKTDPDLDADEILNKGYRIHTTLKLNYQLNAEMVLKRGLVNFSRNHGYSGPKDTFVPTIADEVDEGERLEKLLEVPAYLRSNGFYSGLVLSVDKKEVVALVEENEVRLDLKDHAWAYHANLQHGTKLTDFRIILKENDIIYVVKESRKDGSAWRLVQEPQMEGALLSMEPDTGAILAVVGGFAYERSMFNRASQMRRQPGSLFKPFVYASALEAGFAPMTIIEDKPIIIRETDDEGNDKLYKPKNISGVFYGDLTIKAALARSINVLIMRVAQMIGIPRILNISERFGLDREQLPDDLTVALGSGSVSLEEMVYGFSSFANLGTRQEPYFITRIDDVNGETVYEFEPSEPIRVIAPETAHVMNDLLVNVIKNGTGKRAKVTGRVTGGKTGTSNDNKDAWFIGYYPDIVTGIWIGFDDFSKSLGLSGTGSGAALPIWVQYKLAIASYLPFELFPVSESNVRYYKVDVESKQISDGITSDYTFEPYILDSNNNPRQRQ